MASPDFRDGLAFSPRDFNTTHWTVVLTAQEQDSTRAFKALSELCQTYWYPLYAYIRRRGYDVAEAQDLAQEFFFRLVEKNVLDSVHRDRGKFRSFLLASMNHFLAKEWHRANRQKRGGGCAIISLDDDAAENRYRQEPSTELSADQLFERRWAITLLDNAMRRLRDESMAKGKEPLFEALKGLVSGDRVEGGYAGVAKRFDMTEGAVKVVAHRLRKRYGEIVRDEIAQTISSPDEVEEEIQYLFQVLAR